MNESAIPAELIRAEAIKSYNAAVDAVEAGTDSLKAIELAASSLYLWSKVGNDQNLAIGYWLYSRALAVAGVGALAIEAADKSLEHVAKIESPADWLIASVHEGLARAYLSANDSRAATAIKETERLIAQISDDNDRGLIHAQFSSMGLIGL